MQRKDLKVGMPLYSHFFDDKVTEHTIKYIADNHGGRGNFIVAENDTEQEDDIYDIVCKLQDDVKYNGGIWTDEIFIMQEMEPCKPLYLTSNPHEMPYARFIATQNILDPVVDMFHKKDKNGNHEWQSALTSLCDDEWAKKFDQVLNWYRYYSVNRKQYSPERENLYPLWELKCLLHDVVCGNWIIPLSMAQEISAVFWQYFNEKVCVECGKRESEHGF